MTSTAKPKTLPRVSHAWKDISPSQMQEINSCTSATELKERLSSICNLEKSNYSAIQKQVLLDFFYHTVMFTLNQNVGDEKTSTYFSIMKDVAEQSMNPDVTIVQSFSIFKDLLVKHSVHRPPFSVEVFSLEEVKKFSNYAFNTYFRYYKWYQYVFAKQQQANLYCIYADDRIEKPFSMKALSEEIPEEQILDKKKLAQQLELKLDTKDKAKDRSDDPSTINISSAREPEDTSRSSQDLKTQTVQDDSSIAPKEPNVPHPYIQNQLTEIKNLLSDMTSSKLSEIDSRIAAIEKLVGDKSKKNKPK